MIHDKAGSTFVIRKAKSTFDKTQRIPPHSPQFEQFLVKNLTGILFQSRTKIDQTRIVGQSKFPIKLGKRQIKIAFEVTRFENREFVLRGVATGQ